MSSATTAVLAAAFLVVAVLYSSVGHAGASGYLAAMAIMGVSPEVMKPTSLTLNVLVSIIATVQFARAGHFSWALFWPLAAASIPAAFIGGRIDLPSQYYRPLIGVVLLFSAWRLAATSAKPEPARPVRAPAVAWRLGAGAALGLLSGLSGTGGGIFLSPLMLLLGWASAKRTAAVSAAFILVNSISGLLGVLSRTGSLPGAVPLWIVSVIAGGIVGSYLGAKRLQTRTMRRALAIVLVVAGVKLLLA